MKFFALLILSALCINSFAAVKPFRSGNILAANISSNRPAIKNWNKYIFENNSASSYAAVAVSIHPKRKISIYDYSLYINGRNYTCAAIRTNGGSFEYTQKAFSSTKNEIYTLLFFLPGINASDSVKASLISNIPKNATPSATFPLTEDSELCPFNSIKKDGNFDE